ncbi:carbohydrate ABC transporter permease [Arthrobacter sp. C9C5]|uniref:carbohydrate ABC transporter permease n=1 Tax=Arthrobacter sp. C9C5 TaxID=2735267 RepID=UPI0015858E98|nr:carbohydrate ABC transporter permease [Arthrobacter sp. C9C5]NUU32644.1 carbohydrate ABC transporter permease [Arthrobacter sp. C9C5]
MRNGRRNSVLIHLAAIVVGLAIIAPFALMVIASISPQSNLISRPLQWIPSTLYLDRYQEIFTGGANSVGSAFRSAFANTVIVASGTVAISMVVAILGAYAFARLRFRFRGTVLMIFLATYMLPQIALLIPLYLALSALQLLDTKLGLIIVDCSLVIPFTLWILSNYFVTIPEELEEAALIDGCGRMGALFRVVLPSAKPGIFAALMFSFLLAWDEFMYALIFTSSDASKTLTVAISEFAGRYTTDFGLVAAGGILAALPPVIIAVIFQRYIVSGMAAGAVKG